MKTLLRAALVLSTLTAPMAFAGDAPAKDAKAAPAKDAKAAPAAKKLFMDVHEMGPGKVTAKDAAGAHKKDLAVEKEFGVDFKAYWVDEKNGKIYCLAEAPDADSITAAHKKAHGMLPKMVAEVTEDNAGWKPTAGKKLFLDTHKLGAGKVTPEALAGAHKKDLAVEGKHKVKFLDYWLDMSTGTVMCLAEAPDAAALIATHKEAHGMLPDSVDEVSEGR